MNQMNSDGEPREKKFSETETNETKPSETETREKTEQSQKIDTGVFCLAMLLRFYKCAADPIQIAREYAPDGTPLDKSRVVLAAKGLGLKARAVASSRKRLLKIPVPAMAEDKEGAFFIIARVSEDRVLTQTPGGRPRSLSHDELMEIWSGNLIFVTRRAFVSGAERRFDFTWFIPAIVKYRRLFGEVLIASFFLQLFGLVTPLFFQVVVDKVLAHRGLSTLDVLVTGLLVVIIFEVTLEGLRAYVFSHTTSRMDVELSSRLFKHLLYLPLAYFESRQVGQTVARVRELENIRNFLTSSAVTVALDLLFTLVFIAVMFFYSPMLTFIVMGSIPLYLILSILATPPLRRMIEDKFQKGAANQSFLVEAVTGIETLKAMAVEPQMRSTWERQLTAYVASSFRATILGTVASQGVKLISKATMALILWFGARLVIQGELTIGQLIAFNMLSSQVNAPVLRLAQLWQNFQQMRISVDRLGDLLNCPAEPGYHPNRAAPPNIKGAISFENISFRYGPDAPETLRDISLTIEAGQTIGVVGRSGSGKSTLAKLVQRLHTPERGRVLVDGIDISMVDPAWLRRQIGVVLQDNILFNRSVAENIALANPSMPMEYIIQAAKTAGAHEFILKLSEGYETLIEERGQNLSGGQRQRVAIARALVINPRILIFDEATSALDYESERIIQDNMGMICKNRTVIIIAHRLSAVRGADRIAVLDQGRIIEQGSHETLMNLNGFYRYLHKQQL